MSETITVPEETGSGRHATGAPPRVLALVVAWCPGDPARVGEALLISTANHAPRVFGRGAARVDDPAPRVLLVRQRSGGVESTEPIALEKISRVQLRLVATPAGRLRVSNLGMCRLVGADDEREVELAPGDTLQLGNQLLFVCSSRPAWFGPTPAPVEMHPFGAPDPFGIVGESEAAWTLRARIALAASRLEHVLVRGESGTGKELVAQAIHATSPRAHRMMVARNAATIPVGIVDAELFGNVRNYPNAGIPERAGLVGDANDSTLFLDEFAELPHDAQAHLLRVLDGGEYQRLGEARMRRSDFRLIAATNRPLSAIKHDLLARLPLRIELAGLDSRREDVPLLMIHILRRIVRGAEALRRRLFGTGDAVFPRVSMAMVRALVEHHYTTHARELEATLLAAIEAGDEELTLPSSLAVASPRSPRAQGDAAGEAWLTPERIQQELDRQNGVIEKAYAKLGLPSRHVLARLIKKHGLELRRRPGG